MDYITFLLNHPPQNPKQRIAIDPDHPSRGFTWDEYISMMKRISVGLRSIGVQDGNCIAIFAKSDPYYYVFGDGVLAAGGIFAAIPPFSTARELKHLLKAMRVDWLCVQPEYMGVALAACEEEEEGGFPASRIMCFDEASSSPTEGSRISFSQLLKSDEGTWENRAALKDPSETAFRMPSSGTTGLAKAIEIPHSASIARIVIKDPPDIEPTTERFLHCNGFFHVTGLAAFYQAAVGTHIVYPCFHSDAASILDAIARNNITSVLFSPQVMERVVVYCRAEESKREKLQTVRRVVTSGSAARPDIQQAMKNLLPSSAVLQMSYGTTEAGNIASTPVGEDFTPGYVGMIHPAQEVRILDPETLSPLPQDQPGEVCIHGPRLFREYLDNPFATTSSTFPDPTNPQKIWYRTGDQGHISSLNNQQLALTARLSEIFKVNLEHVSPIEVESELLLHPSVQDAAVTCIPAREGRDDNECIAYIVKREGGKERVDASGILEFMRERVAEHKVPTGGVIFVEGIPRNGLGKVLRRELEGLRGLEGSVRYF